MDFPERQGTKPAKEEFEDTHPHTGSGQAGRKIYVPTAQQDGLHNSFSPTDLKKKEHVPSENLVEIKYDVRLSNVG